MDERPHAADDIAQSSLLTILKQLANDPDKDVSPKVVVGSRAKDGYRAARRRKERPLKTDIEQASAPAVAESADELEVVQSATAFLEQRDFELLSAWAEDRADLASESQRNRASRRGLTLASFRRHLGRIDTHIQDSLARYRGVGKVLEAHARSLRTLLDSPPSSRTVFLDVSQMTTGGIAFGVGGFCAGYVRANSEPARACRRCRRLRWPVSRNFVLDVRVLTRRIADSFLQAATSLVAANIKVYVCLPKPDQFSQFAADVGVVGDVAHRLVRREGRPHFLLSDRGSRGFRDVGERIDASMKAAVPLTRPEEIREVYEHLLGRLARPWHEALLRPDRRNAEGSR